MKNLTDRFRNPKIQAIVTKDKSKFIIAKQFLKHHMQNGTVGVISPFHLTENGYNSNISFQINRKSRIQSISHMIPKITSYTIQDQNILFDCIGKLPSELFYGLEDGFIHFDVKFKNEPIIKPRMIIQEDYSLEQFGIVLSEPDVKFKTDKLKIFPVLLKNGFMISIVDNHSAILYSVICDPKGLTIGECVRSQISNITQYILPTWNEFFKLSINSTSPDVLIELNEEIFDSTLTKYSHPIFVKMERHFNQIEFIKFQIIGIGKSE